MVPDTVEVDELQNGVRREGAISGTWHFVVKQVWPVVPLSPAYETGSEQRKFQIDEAHDIFNLKR